MPAGHIDSGLISTLVPSLRHSEFQHLLEWLALSLIAALMVSALSAFFLYCAEYIVSRDRRSSDALYEIKRRTPLLKGLMRRRESVSKSLADTNARLNAEVRLYERASSVLGQLKRRQSTLVRFGNEPDRELRCFAGYVYNDFVRKYVAKGQHYPLLDDGWALAQLVEVWADTPERAEIEIARKFPKTFGFYLSSLEVVKPISRAGLAAPDGPDGPDL